MKLYTHNELINALQSLDRKNISQSYVNEMENFPATSTFKRYFGSWKNALCSAGLETGVITGRPQGPPIVISPDALEIINGELLGDGCLSMTGSSKSNACFAHSTANIEYGKYLYNELFKLNVPLLKPEILPPRNNGKTQFRTRSISNVSWTDLHHKWYPNGVKIVPTDLVFTRKLCLHWYLGDGYFEAGTCKISTCGFTEHENETLSNMLTNIGFRAAKTKRSGGYYIVKFDKNSYKDFLNWIGDCPAKGYEHRWNKV